MNSRGNSSESLSASSGALLLGSDDVRKNAVVSSSGQILILPETVAFFDSSKHPSRIGETAADQDQQPQHEHERDHDPVLLRHVSLELLNPIYECKSRKTSMAVAIVSLVATVCGGGVLSLPLAFRRAGILPTTFFMIYAALSTDFSIYILVSCARRTGGRSYGDVAKAAFGNAAQVATTLLLGLMLIGGLTAYLVLVKDIWTPVILSLLPAALQEPFLQQQQHHHQSQDDNSYDISNTITELVPSKHGANMILLGILIVGSPLLLKHDLHALRHTCYVGFSSCTLLMVAIVYRAWQAVSTLEYDSNVEERRGNLNWYSTDVSDLAYAFPIVVLCFFCSYNVLGVHSSMLNPTRPRMKCVLDTSMLICFFLFYAVGLGGYIYALDATCDNILLNFELSDPAILLGRMGFCFTLLFGLPLVTLPCRDAFRAIPAQIRAWRVDATLAQEFKEVDLRRNQGSHLVINGVDFDEAEPFLVTADPEKQHATMLTYGATHSVEHVIGAATSAEDDGTAATSDAGMQSQHSDDEMTYLGEKVNVEPFIHFGSTFAVVGLCYMFAISVPGVGFVWSLAGSSMAIVIAFIVPTACYLKIRGHKRMNPRSVSAWALLLISAIAAPICTRQAILSR